MVYSEFIKKTVKYLKSVRILKNYVAFDMMFPTSWNMLKNAPEGMEIFQNQDNDSKIITSFVCENNSSLIDLVEKTIDSVVSANLEREEKERLFKMKVSELKGIFESGDIESLRSLKFDTNELTTLTSSNGTTQKLTPVTEGNGNIEGGNKKA
jgi:hypothetical protein